MKTETLLKHLRVLVLFYKRRWTVEQIAEASEYTPLTVRKILRSKPMKPYIMRLTNGFVEKARSYFDRMVADMEAGQYSTEKEPCEA